VTKTVSERQETKYIRNLRKQIIKLKRENAYLKKRNTRIENDFAEFHAESENETEEPIEEKKATEKPVTCPKCHQEVVVFELREVKYFKCHGCGKKGRLLINE